jgi:hypothetical protein
VSFVSFETELTFNLGWSEITRVHGAAIVSKLLQPADKSYKSGERSVHARPKKKPVIRRAVKEQIRFFLFISIVLPFPIPPSPPLFRPRLRDLLQLPPPPPSQIWGSIEVGDGVSLRYRRFPFSIRRYLPFNRLRFFGALYFLHVSLSGTFLPLILILSQLMVSFAPL